MQQHQELIDKFSKNLFWDVDKSMIDLDKYPSHIIQRVLEYGKLEDWRIVRTYYGLDKIVECCRKLRTLDPKALAFICCISRTDKTTYRCYNFAQSCPTLWNSREVSRGSIYKNGSSLIWLKKAMAIRLEGDTLSNPGHRPG